MFYESLSFLRKNIFRDKNPLGRAVGFCPVCVLCWYIYIFALLKFIPSAPGLKSFSFLGVGEGEENFITSFSERHWRKIIVCIYFGETPSRSRAHHRTHSTNLACLLKSLPAVSKCCNLSIGINAHAIFYLQPSNVYLSSWKTRKCIAFSFFTKFWHYVS